MGLYVLYWPISLQRLKGYINSSCYYHHQIGSIPRSHCYHIVVWLCVWDVCYIIFCYLLHYTFRENRECVFIIIVQFMMTASSRKRFGLKIVFVYSYITACHYHHCANLSKDIELIMSKIRHILSVIHYTICGAVCFQFNHFPFDDWENIYTLSYYHHQIGSMNYYPLYRVRPWNNDVRCMSLSILMYIQSGYRVHFTVWVLHYLNLSSMMMSEALYIRNWLGKSEQY